MPDIKRSWYKEMSVYQIWPRSFADGNGDGIGDLEGIISKLDYIKSLGVDAIWFSPLFKSPNADYGYDISDYRDISEDYGTLEQFRTMLDEAHKRGIKVIMDLVINHTSDEHEWFKKSLENKNPDNPYHDYYFWRPGKGKNPPNNWLSVFEGGAWEYDDALDEYYLHIFAKKQPDLNMDNPAVRNEVKDIMRFWLDMGVDGFREDVITYISKREGLPDGKPLPVGCGLEHFTNGPRLKEYLTEFKDDVLSKYDCMTVGEAPMMTPELAKEFIAEGPGQMLNMMFHFQHMEADCFMTEWVRLPFNLRKMKRAFSRWQEKMYGTAWNALYMENHDHARIVNRYGSLKYRVESAKMLAATYILQSGTPFVYQGQELGMTNITMPDINMCKDVLTFNNQKLFKKLGMSDKAFLKLSNKASRENARTPMQWSAAKNAGFTDGEPWFPVNPNYKKINAEEEESNPNSVLNFYRALLKYRKGSDLVIYGKYREFYNNSGSLYVYERCLRGERLLVVCSYTEKAVRFKAPAGYNLSKCELLFKNYDYTPLEGNGFVTKPYEVRVYKFG